MKSNKFRFFPSLKRYSKGEYIALFNPYNLAKVYLTKKEYENILTFKTSQTTINKLFKKNILVEKDFDFPHYLDKFRKEHLKERPNISLMYLLLTENCNYDCKYCFIEHRIRKNTQNMTINTAKKALDIFHHLTKPKKNKKIIFYGGEPLLNKKVLLYVIKKEKIDQKTKISIVTNGSLIDKKIAKIFAKNKIDVSVSIDGDKETHNKMRVFYQSNRPTFEETLRGFFLLKEAGCKPSISCTVGPHNYKKLEQIMEYFIKIGAAGIGFNLLTYCPIKNPPKVESVAENMIKAYDVARANGIVENRIYTRKVKPFVEEKPWVKDCAGYGNQITVTPKGMIGPCHAFWPENKYFEPITKKAKKITDSNTWKEWNSRTAYNMPKCLNCPSISLCGGGCAYYAYTQQKDIWSADKRICSFSNKVLEWMIWDLFEKMQQKELLVEGKKIIIRPISSTDPRRWKKFLLNLKKENTFLSVNELLDIGKKWVKDMISLNYNQKGYTLVLLEKNKIIGFANIVPEGKDCNIGIALLKEFCGKGMGKKMAKILEKKAKELGYKKIIFKTKKENESAKALAKKLQYKKIREEENKIIFEKELKQKK